MKCPKCQAENPEQNQFCRKCGTKLSMICPNCSADVLLADKFCGKCGHDLGELTEAPEIDFNQPQSYTPKFLADKILNNRSSIEGERKLVTVLFADVADYTSMAEKLDPEEVHQIMDGCFKILMDEVHSYEGTINQFTGDGVMALFGAPVAHEDHAQRACHAALSIQKALGDYGQKLKDDCGVDFLMRIGLNSGPVIVGSIGDDLRMDYTAVGDTTNLAARMEGMANPGTILGTAYTHKLARDFFEFESLGKVEVKGKEEPVEAYELKKASEVETRIEAAAAKGLTKFAGRKKSIAALMEAYDKAKSGSGQVVGVVGEAGVGKSRLLIELRSELAKEEYIYLEGRCLHYGSSMAYLPIHDILKSYFDIKEGHQEDLIKKKVEEKIFHFDERLKSALPPFQELLSVKVEDDTYLQLEPAAKKIRTFEGIRDLLVCESENKPLVFVVEDLHWIDSLSEEFLNYLIDWLAGTHILLILLYRPEYAHQWGSKSFYSKIGVDQLTTKSSAQLVQNILEGGEVVPELKELILNRAGGNPLFVEELTHSLLENGSIQRQDHQYVLNRKSSEIEVPDTIQGIIAARIDRIEESLKQIMQVASVIGREFAYRILQTIMGMREELKSSLINLQGLEFIYEKSLFPELEYIFKHALTQEVAYNSLLQKRRKEIHEKIAVAIEEIYQDRLEEYYELLAYHYMKSNNKQKAVEYLKLAGQQAVQRSANAEAVSHLTSALELLKASPDTSERTQQELTLQIALGASLAATKGHGAAEVERVYIRARELCQQVGETPQLFPVLFGLWRFYNFRSELQTARELAEELMSLARNVQDPALLLQAHRALGAALFYHGEIGPSQAHLEQAFALYDSQQHRSLAFLYGIVSGVYCLTFEAYALWLLGYPEQALKKREEALTLAQDLSHPYSLAFALSHGALLHQYRQEVQAAQEQAEAAIAVCTEQGFPYWLAMGTILRGWAMAEQGQEEEGIAQMRQGLAAYRATGAELRRPYYISLLAEACGKKGQAEEGLNTLAEALNTVNKTGERWYEAELFRLKGELLLKSEIQRLSEAETCFRQAIDITRCQSAKSLELRAVMSLSRLWQQQGKNAQAQHKLAEIYGWFTEGFDTPDLKEAKALLEELM